VAREGRVPTSFTLWVRLATVAAIAAFGGTNAGRAPNDLEALPVGWVPAPPWHPLVLRSLRDRGLDGHGLIDPIQGAVLVLPAPALGQPARDGEEAGKHSLNPVTTRQGAILRA